MSLLSNGGVKGPMGRRWANCNLAVTYRQVRPGVTAANSTLKRTALAPQICRGREIWGLS